MKVDKFFENFELLTDAPNAVPKLREIILKLAVQGKLVRQDPTDESASVLLAKIQAYREQLSEQKKLQQIKQFPVINNREIDFTIPDNWKIARLGELFDFTYGKSLPEKSRDNSGCYPVYGSNGIVGHHNTFLTSEPSLIIGRKGSSGAINIASQPFWAIDTTYYVTPPKGIDLLFSYYLLKSLELEKLDKSTAIPGLNRHDAYILPLAMPPTKEQKRIVEKCDRLLSFCNQIEVKQRKRLESIVKINESAIAQLLSSQNPDEFSQHWEGICNNFDLLYSIPETIPKLRQAILQLAVQGKLVRQDPNDEPASVLLEKIQLIKKQLIKKKQIEKGTSSKAIALDEIPYNFPKTWEWIQLGQLVLLMDAGWSPACKQYPTKNSDTWGVLKTTAVQNLNYQWAEHKELPQNLNPRPEYEVKVGDILITRAGPKNRVGICCLVKDTRPKLMMSDKIIRFHLIEELLFPDFVVLSLNAGFSQSYIESQKSGMAESQMNISQVKLRTTPVPIPPLAEQKRIVAKVDRLMSLCDTLEAKLKEARSHSDKLMEVAAKQLLVL